MFLLEILLFWIPFVGSFIAGFVGGRKAGDVGNAVAAVFLPLIVFSILFGVLATAVTAVPLLGLFAGLGGFAFAATHVVPLLVGAAVGGLTVDRGGTGG
jgi:choline-glycine betaine transporter